MSADDVASMLTEHREKLPFYRLTKDYVDGRHRPMYSSETFTEAFRIVMAQLRENLCPAVIDGPGQLLNISNWQGVGADQAVDVWDQQRMRARSNVVHREALRAGDSYVLVWGAGNTPTDDPQLWPHRAEQMWVRYSTERFDQLDVAAKFWLHEKRLRVNLYYPDRVERWVSKQAHNEAGNVQVRGDSFEPYSDDDGPDTINHAFGQVPVVHFPNSTDIGSFGRSELTDVIPLQDGLNTSLTNVVVASEAYALPFRALFGFQPGVDPITRKPVPLDYDPKRDQFLAFPGDKTRLEQFTPADITKLNEVSEGWVSRISRVVGLPPSYFFQIAGDFPSGESQRQASARLTANVRDLQQTWDPQWKRVQELAGVPDAWPVWDDPAPASEQEKWQTAVLRDQAGVPLRANLREVGWSDDKIDATLDEAAADQANAGQLAVDAFRQGQSASNLLR